MKALRTAGAIIIGVMTLQAEDFRLKSINAAGSITLQTTLTHDGRGERLIATAKNESGAGILYARICITSAGMKKGCLFELWNTAVWAPGAEIRWDVTTRRKVPDLSHDAVIEEFEMVRGSPDLVSSRSTDIENPDLSPRPVQTPASQPEPPKPAPAVRARLPVPVPAPEKRDPSMSNDSVIKLVSGGLSDSAIIGIINSQPGEYSFTASAVAALRQAGVSDGVIGAMIRKRGDVFPSAVSSPASDRR